MSMAATHANWTVDMVDALPDDGQRYELIDGELYMTPAPAEVPTTIFASFGFQPVRSDSILPS